MTMMKLVDGELVPMTDEEVAQYEADQSEAAVPAVPAQVSRAQAKIALSRNGLLAQTEQAVAAAGGEVAIWYADALNWRRDNENVIGIGMALNLTSDQIDDLFRQASQIEA